MDEPAGAAGTARFRGADVEPLVEINGECGNQRRQIAGIGAGRYSSSRVWSKTR